MVVLDHDDVSSNCDDFSRDNNDGVVVVVMGCDGGGTLRGGVSNGGDNSRVDVGNIMVAGK